MKKLPMFVLASAALFLSGCAATTGSGSTQNTPKAPAGPATTSAAAPSMIGAGTSLVVRTTEAISTARDTPGKTYSAEVTNDIVDQGGSLLVPKGSSVQLTVVASPTGGTASAPDQQLAVLSITVRGRTYQVTSATTEGVSPVSPGQSASATEKPRSGALLGTVTGTTAGGGAAAGDVMTRGKEVRVPANSVLTFRLEQTIQLVGYTP